MWYLRQKELVLNNMEIEELIKKCSAITLEEEDEDRVIFGGNMKEKRGSDRSRVLSWKNSHNERSQSRGD